MIWRLNRVFVVLLIVAAALYFVLMNRDSVTVFLSSSRSFTFPLGIVLIIAFVTGLLSAMLAGLLTGLRAYFRERGFIKRERESQFFYQQVLQARSASASHEWAKARELWQRMVSYDPTDVIARVELSRCIERDGDPLLALHELDLTRRYTDRKEQCEVLFRAAELNVVLNNKTAALDNLALLMANSPSQRAALLARDLSEQIERFEDALEYHRSLHNLSEAAPADNAEFVARIETKKALKIEDQIERLAQLESLLKKHQNCELLLREFSKLALAENDFERAATFMVRTAKVSGLQSDWALAVQYWTKMGDPKRALAAARTARKETKPDQKIWAELALVRLELSLDMYDEAEERLKQLQLSNIDNLTDSKSTCENLSLQIAMLRGALVAFRGNSQDARKIWRDLLESGNPRSSEISDSSKKILKV